VSHSDKPTRLLHGFITKGCMSFMPQALVPAHRVVLYKGLYKGRSALLSNVILGQKCPKSSLLHDIVN